MLKAILIDDEPNSVKLLSLQLQEHCPQVEVVAKCTSSTQGLECIQSLKPDIVFLDIEMPIMNGFQLLEKLDEINFCLVFVTAYDAFALKAFRFSALDYLLKPIEKEALKEAVRKAEKQHRVDEKQIDMLKMQIHSGQLPQKLAVPYSGGILFIELKEIVFCEADSNYTKIVLASGKSLVLSKTLRDVQEFLQERNFQRVHRQYLINLDHIKEYVRGEGNYIIMSNNVSIPVSRNQKDELLNRFGWL